MLLRWALLFAGMLAVSPLWAARGPDWRPERRLGSDRLALAAIRTIVVPESAGPELTAAVADLRELWTERVGPLAAVGGAGPLPMPKLAIVLERRARAPRVPGAFEIRRDDTRVRVRAADQEGLVNGVYALAGEVLGARWYWPGELGFEWVGEVPEFFPDRRWSETPAFAQRTLQPVDTDFGRRNRLVRRFSFNHNLARIFSPELFEAEPEVFPEIKGEVRAPRGSARNDAQPDFTHPRTVELAAEAVREHFARHPESRSFSLSVNDNTLFDESEATEAAVSPVEYFRGRPNYTDLVFDFMNQVARRAFDETEPQRADLAEPSDLPSPSEQAGPFHWFRERFAFLRPSASDGGERRYVTALAYYWTEQSPSFELHPQVMPVLTSDRAQWHDPACRAQDKALIERWAASGAQRIATWDYYFGAPYPYPRQFTQWITESIRFLHRNGVDVFFSQLPSMWGHDGPKAWLAAELLWDPEQDAAALLEEYYEAFFGAAAEDVRAFYETAEAHRNTHAGRADWIKYYKDEAGIELFGEEVLTELRGHIEAARAAVAADPRRAARVEVLSEAFELTELYAAYHGARVALLEGAENVPGASLGPAPAGLSLEVGNSASPVGASSDAQLFPSTLQILGAAARFLHNRAAFEARAADLVAKPYHKAFHYFLRVKQTDPLPLLFKEWAESETGDQALAEGESPDAKEGRVETGRRFSSFDRIKTRLLSLYADQWAIARTLASAPEAFRSMLDDPGLAHAGEPVSAHFLGPRLPVVSGWRMDYRPTEHLVVAAAFRDESRAHGFRVSGSDMFSIFRDFPVVGMRDYALKMELAWRVSPDNRTQVRLTWRNRAGKTLRVDLPLQLPRGSSEGGRDFVYPVRAPEGAYNVRVHFTQSRQAPHDFFELRSADFGLVAE
ncbi:MAG: DUF4838 domain-containing protein [Opitutales bacterium]